MPLVIHLEGNIGWGTSEFPEGRRINMHEPESGAIISCPFAGDALAKLVRELSQALSDEQKRELAPLFTSGIIIPNGQNFQAGPQG